MKQQSNPYSECEGCKDLGDCKHVEVALDLLGSPLPPADCPHYHKIMKQTEKKRKHDRDTT